MEQLTFLKCRDSEPCQPGGSDGTLRKRGRHCAPATMHGVSVSDHGEKGRWSNVDYWEMRKKKLEEQTVDSDLYGAVASRLLGGGSSSSTVPLDKVRPSQIFASCHFYFDGRVDGGRGEGLSAFGLGKLARLHGAHVGPVLTKRGVTHVICTQLSGAKEKQALRSASSTNNKCQYFVLPSWITESVVANRRLAESRFSLLAKIAAEARIAKPIPFALHVAIGDPPLSSRVTHAVVTMKAKRCRAKFVENTAGIQPDLIAACADRSISRPRVSRPSRFQTHCARASADLPSAALRAFPSTSASIAVPPVPARLGGHGLPVSRPASIHRAAPELLAIDDSPDFSKQQVATSADPAGSPESAAPTQLDSSDDDADGESNGQGHEVWLADALGIRSASVPAKRMEETPKRFSRPRALGA